MSLYRRNPRRDSNEQSIVQALRAQGFTVDRVSGTGLPDLLLSKAGRMWLIEVKMPKGRLKPAQEAWRARWRGPQPIIVRSVEDACHFALLACETPEREARSEQ